MNDSSGRFLASLLSSGVAEAITLPIDIVKVRLQVQNISRDSKMKYDGLIDCGRKINSSEGTAALWKGLSPSLLRQCSYTSCSFLLYEPVRDFISSSTPFFLNDGSPSYFQRLLSGGTAGGISISIFNWTDVLKTRMQTSTSKSRLGIVSILKQILASDGHRGLFAGLKPNVVRTFLVNAAELGTYDEAKSRLVLLVGDNVCAHIGASAIAGICSAAVSTPADVIKTRFMDAAGRGADFTGRQYSGLFNALETIAREEGPAALYKGFVPICFRKVIWCTSFFVLYEQTRASIS